GGERWALGAGFWAPYGLTLTWPVDFPGRFGGYDNTVKAIYIQPTAAYQLIPKRLSVGAGLDVAMGTVDLNLREDLATVPVPGAGGATFNNFGIPFGTDFANANLHGTGTAVSGHFGALLKITDALSIGGRYMMGAKVKFNNGKATFSPVATGRILPAGNPFGAPAGFPLDQLLAAQFTGNGALVSQGIKTAITFPAQAVVGVAWKAIPSVELSGDWQWTNWAKWDSVALNFANGSTQQLYLINQNTNTFRVGGQWAATPELELRGGWGYNGKGAETDIAVSPLLPEGKRNYYAAGLGYRLTKDLSADLFYQHVVQAARRGRLYPLTAGQVAAFNSSGSTTGVNTGLYTSKGDLFGATLRYTFGPAR
ncbi:MAG TPA: outer membrane protein transport protein, partial [Longimicrobiales bacterium]